MLLGKTHPYRHQFDDSTSIAEPSKDRVLVLPHTKVSKNTILRQIRKHLADELRNFPIGAEHGHR